MCLAIVPSCFPRDDMHRGRDRPMKPTSPFPVPSIPNPMATIPWRAMEAHKCCDRKKKKNKRKTKKRIDEASPDHMLLRPVLQLQVDKPPCNSRCAKPNLCEMSQQNPVHGLDQVLEETHRCNKEWKSHYDTRHTHRRCKNSQQDWISAHPPNALDDLRNPKRAGSSIFICPCRDK